MAVIKKVFAGAELDWAEKQLLEWKEYIDAHPLVSLKDRVGHKTTSNGGMIPYTIANIETQGKFIQDTLKNYLALLKEVDNMRSIEEEKKKGGRGIDELSPLENGSI